MPDSDSIEKLKLEAADLHRRLAEVERKIATLGAVQTRGPAAKVANGGFEGAYEELEVTYKTAPVGLCLLDRELRFVRVNEALAVMNQLTPQDLIGRTVRKIIPSIGDLADQVAQTILMTGEGVRDIEFSGEVAAQPGRRRVWRDQWFPLRSGDGEIVGFNVVAEEITAQREAEDRARLAEERFRTAYAELQATYETAPVALGVLDRELRLLRLNRALAEMLEMPAQDILGHTVRELVPSIADDLEAVARQVFATGNPLRDIEFAGKLPHQPDRLHTWCVQWYPLLSAAGEVTGINVVAEEITVQREAEQRAQEAEERFRAAFAELQATYETAPIALCVLDRELRYVRINQALANMIEMRPEDVLGRTIREVVPSVADDLEGAARRVFATGDPVRDVEFVGDLSHQPGRPHTWREQWYPLRSSQGDLVGINVVAEDITAQREAEQALRAAEERASTTLEELEATYSTAPIGLCVLDRDLRYLRINNWLAEFNKVSVEQTLGRTVYEINPEFASQIDQLARQVFTTGEPVLGYEFTGETEPGNRWTTRTSWFPMRNGDGDIVALNIAVEDISEQRLTAEALHVAEGRARTALEELEATYETAPVGLCVLDRDLRYVRLNKRQEEISGIPAEEVVGRTVPEVFPAYAEEAYRAAAKALETGQAVRLEMSGETLAAPGHRRYWYNNWYPLCSQDGRTIGFNIVVEDITAQREADREREELLRTTERALLQAERSRAFVEQAQNIIDASAGERPLDDLLRVLIELVMKTLKTDSATVLLSKLDEEEGPIEDDKRAVCVRASIGLHNPGEQLPIPFRQGYAGRIVASGSPLVWEEVDYRNVVGTIFEERGIKSLAGVPLRADGRILGVLHVGSVTRRAFTPDEVHLLEIAAERIGLGVQRALAAAAQKRAEEALLATNRHKDEFLAMLAHELRNPLAPIQNAVELLSKLGSNEPLLERPRDIIRRQLAHLTRVIDDLMDISRITAGKITLIRQRVKIAEVVRAALVTSEPGIVERKHTLWVNVPENLHIDGDQARLAQVVTNLLLNAVKYTPIGGNISVTATKKANHAVLAVKDTGIGIAKEAQDRIFELFSQEDASLDRSGGGLGVGLMLVKRLVEMHGGSVEVHSEGPGRGAEFTVDLPLLETADGLVDSIRQEEEKPGNSLTILIVEDNPDTAESFQLLLELYGHKAFVAKDGIQALRLLKEIDPAIAFVDIGLPGIDGYEVARRIRQSGNNDLLLIAVSGYGREEDKRKAFEAGFDNHITKPVNWAALEVLLTQFEPSRRASASPPPYGERL